MAKTDRFMGFKVSIPDTPYTIEKIDDLNWTLRRNSVVPAVNANTGEPNKRAGEAVVENIYHYPTLGMACKNIARFLADEGDTEAAMTLEDYAQRLRRIGRDIEESVNEQIKEFCGA